MNLEAHITKDKNLLICHADIDLSKIDAVEFHYVKEHFCGTVYANYSAMFLPQAKGDLFLCGDISKLPAHVWSVDAVKKPYVIKELSYNYGDCDFERVSCSQVPIIINDVGVYYRQMFNTDEDLFNSIKYEHVFQDLTESTKPNNAFRKGLYLSKVEKYGDNLKFNLLRCSSNLSGPTENFQNTDRYIIQDVNIASQTVFDKPAALNHVLAQVYTNYKPHWFTVWVYTLVNYIWLLLFKRNYYKPTEKKAKIKSHSDKTKDMPRNGLIAFCTFYDSFSDNTFYDTRLGLKRSKTDKYDWCYKDTSALTVLHFKLKPADKRTQPLDESVAALVKEFSITLYPNSVFIIPLWTNRLYTHEIRPSVLSVDNIPTRLGYVIRCSDTKALFTNATTHIMAKDGSLTPLKAITPQDATAIRELYLKENLTDEVIEYDDTYFSMNSGDYKKPII